MSAAERPAPDGMMPSSTAATPGPQLREAREARGITLEAAASQLRLDPELLRAIEADRAQSIAAPAYVRGYLRSYARLVGLDSERVLATYAAIASSEPPPLKGSASRERPQASSADRPVKLASFVIAATLFALVLAWWQSRQPGNGWLDIAQPLLDHINPGAETTGNDTRPAAMPASGTATPLASPGPEPMPAPVSESLESNPSIEPAADETGTGAATGAQNFSTGAAILTLSVSPDASSWIEVHDNSGNRLYYAQAQAGEVVNLEGAPPYRIVIGNAPGVGVQFNGTAIDVAPYSVSGVARLQLDATGAAAP